MTTDSSIDVAASEETREPRTIDEIAQVVRKSGYSPLTDEEIDRYMEYRAEQAVKLAQIDAQSAALDRAHEKWLEECRAAQSRAEESFQRAVSVRTEFAAVSRE